MDPGWDAIASRPSQRPRRRETFKNVPQEANPILDLHLATDAWILRRIRSDAGGASP